jgi:hypothetical protein
MVMAEVPASLFFYSPKIGDLIRFKCTQKGKKELIIIYGTEEKNCVTVFKKMFHLMLLMTARKMKG